MTTILESFVASQSIHGAQRKKILRYDNLSRHVKNKHRKDLVAVNTKIRNLPKKRKYLGTTSTPNEIVKEIKKWWKSRDRPGSVTSFFSEEGYVYSPYS